jgi:predicted nicotinamide N-methyase
MSIIELGSGPGLAGLLAAKLGGRVVITDKGVVLPLIQENIQLNGLSATSTATGSGTAEVSDRRHTLSATYDTSWQGGR